MPSVSTAISVLTMPPRSMSARVSRTQGCSIVDVTQRDPCSSSRPRNAMLVASVAPEVKTMRLSLSAPMSEAIWLRAFSTASWAR